MKDLSGKARSVLERYRGAESLREAEKARWLEALGQRAAKGDMPRYGLGVPFPSPVRRPGLVESAWSAPLAKGIAGVGFVAAILAGIGVKRGASVEAPAAPVMVRGPETPRELPASTRVAAPTDSTPLAEPIVVAPSSRAEPHRPKAPAMRRAVDPRGDAPAPGPPPLPIGEPTVDEEVRLLRDAQNALKSGDPRRALEILEDHATRFPSGKLSDAREVARLVALCDAGEHSAARAGAESFLARHPGSPFSDRVRRICGTAVGAP